MARGWLLVLLGAAVGVACVTPTPYGDSDTNGQKTSLPGDDDDDGTTNPTTSSSSGGANFDGGIPDGGTLATQSCRGTAAFGAPVLIGAISDPNLDEWSVSLTSDELNIVINRGDDDELLLAKRTSISSAFATPQSIGAGAYSPVVSADGSTLLSADQSSFVLSQQPLTLATGALGAKTAVTLNGFTENQWDNPSLSADGATFCWGDTPNPDSKTSIYHVKCGAKVGTTLASPTTFDTLESFGDAFGPTFSADRLTLYFGHADSDGGWHIYETTRASVTADFGAPVARAELNASATSSDIPKFISADACRLYLVSAPSGGHYDVFVATRPPS